MGSKSACLLYEMLFLIILHLVWAASKQNATNQKGNYIRSIRNSALSFSSDIVKAILTTDIKEEFYFSIFV